MRKYILLIFLAGYFSQVTAQIHISQATEEKAMQLLTGAEAYFRADSMQQALEGTKEHPGLIAIINEYGATRAGNLARFYAGSAYLKLNNYKAAIDALLPFHSDSPALLSNGYKLLADAYASDRQYENAKLYYVKAAHENETDAASSGDYLLMAAHLTEKVLLQEPEAQLMYKEIVTRFPKTPAAAQAATRIRNVTSNLLTGADRINVYLPLIKGKRVGVFANQTSMVGNTHLVDTLLKLGVQVKMIFGPEHGFRGTADAGEKVGNYIDEKTGIPVVSLFGSKKRPSSEDLRDIDLLIFDIQDVGVRFYTYISSLEDFMNAAFEEGKPLMILDRPNPNGFYVDGPVLDTAYRSFVGRQPIPIVYGMTIAEYAMMIAGEQWLSEKANARYAYYKTAENSVDTPFHFQVIKCKGYDHTTHYVLPVKPSPNLPVIQSIYLYPSTCLFEGTVLSEGRGTNLPFQVFGHPLLPKKLYSFVPQPNEGASNSKHYGKRCYGWNLSGTPEQVLAKVNNKVQLKWLIEAYRLFPDKDHFFLEPKSGKMEQSYITKLAGTNELWQQIRNGVSEEAIRASWQEKLTAFKIIRKKYLLYDDFE